MAAVARHPLSLMSCVREPPPSSPTSASPPDHFADHKKCNSAGGGGGGNSFRPLRGLRRIFRRKPRATAPALAPPPTPSEAPSPAGGAPAAAVGTCPTPEYMGRSLTGRSVSHDSVFTTEPVASSRQSSDHSASPSASDSAHSLQLTQLVTPTKNAAAVAAELAGALRRRGQCKDSSEDSASAVKQDGINGSSLSVASSNLEEEWIGVPSSLHVSASSSSDKSPSPVELEGVVSITAPLSHTAARHKMAVKPRRNHGGPSRAGRRPHQVSTPSLPTTPELNEDSPVESSDSNAFSDADPNRLFPGDRRAGSATPPSPEPEGEPEPAPEAVHGPSVAHQLKSASLPPGLALRPVAVTRSRSSATYHQVARENHQVAKYPRSGSSEQLADRTTHQDPERRDKERSFFSRLLSRRSGKKKKKDADDSPAGSPAGSDAYLSVYASQESEAPFLPRRIDERGRYADGASPTPQYTANKQTKVSSVARTGPAARQRADPQTIPVTRTIDLDSGDEEVRPRYDKASPLEGVPFPVKPEGAVTRMQISYSTSPTKPSWNHFSSDEDLESKSKVRLPALSAFQKRVSAMKDDDVDSRTELDSLEPPPVPKAPSQDSLSRETPNDNYSDVMEHFEQEINTISLAHRGDSSCGSIDSLEPANKMEHGDHVPARNGDADLASLDSIENLEPSAARAEDGQGQGMYQVTIPCGSDGVSITHRVMDLEEAGDGHAVTVACGSPPSVSVPNITLINLTDTQQGIERDESDAMQAHSEIHGLSEKVESKHSDKAEKPAETKLPEKPQPKDRHAEKTEGDKAPEKTEKREKPVIPEKPDFSSEELGLLLKAEEKPRLPVARKSVIHEETPAVPEFMRVQLNHVDSKPSVNVVLSTSSIDEKKREDEEAEDAKRDLRRKSVDIVDIDIVEATDKVAAVESPVVSDSIIVDPRFVSPPKEADTPNSQPLPEQKTEETPVNPAPLKSPVKPHKPFPLPLSQKPALIPPAKKSPVKRSPSKPEALKPESPTEPMKKLLVEERDKMVIVEKKKPASPTTEEPVVLRRSSKETPRDEGAKSWDPAHTVHPEVVLRKKSLSREVGSKKDDECELMKVFARRSLKVKDGDETFVISQAWNTDPSPDSPEKIEGEKSRSRDSDKENDGAESPKDERKKDLKETKSMTNTFKNEIIKVEKKDSLPEKRLRIRNMADVPEKTTDKPNKFGRAALLRSESVEEKVVAQPEVQAPKVASRWMAAPAPTPVSAPANPPPPTSAAPTPAPTTPTEAPTSTPTPPTDPASLPRFKRIQQRKEEWEQRAQQAAGKAAP